MIEIKEGVKVNGLRTEILLAIVLADRVYSDYGISCVLTEVTGGKHGRASLHYVGLAVDLRTRDMPSGIAEEIVQELKKALGSQYDVVLEKDHIHIEFQPK